VASFVLLFASVKIDQFAESHFGHLIQNWSFKNYFEMNPFDKCQKLTPLSREPNTLFYLLIKAQRYQIYL